MKQILILEREEIHTLIKGKVLVLSTGVGEIGIQFEREASLPPSSEPLAREQLRLKCDVCGATTRKDGQPFKSPASVVRHKMMEHTPGGKKLKGRIGRAMGRLGKARAAKQQEANGHAA